MYVNRETKSEISLPHGCHNVVNTPTLKAMNLGHTSFYWCLPSWHPPPPPPNLPPLAPTWPQTTCAGCLPVQGTAALGAVSATAPSVLRKLPVHGLKSQWLTPCSNSDNKGWFWFDSVYSSSEFESSRLSVSSLSLSRSFSAFSTYSKSAYRLKTGLRDIDAVYCWWAAILND